MKNKMYKTFSIIAQRFQAKTQSSLRALGEGVAIQNSSKKVDFHVAYAPRNDDFETTNYLNSISLIVALPLCLSGCMGIYEGGFECPPGKGVGCKSISDVNQMVDQGDLPERSHPDLPQPYCKKCGTHQDQEIDPKHHEKPKVWYAPLNLEEV